MRWGFVEWLITKHKYPYRCWSFAVPIRAGHVLLAVMHPGDEDSRQPVEGSTGPPTALSAGLGSTLGGTLPCVTCGYNLQSLSILGVCPECGTAVRATILSVVDPLAAELRPIPQPRLVAFGLTLWASAALGALGLSVWMVATELAQIHGGLRSSDWLAQSWWVAGLLWLSGLGAITLIRPHEAIPKSHVVLATLGVLAYVPMGLGVVQLGHLAARAAMTGQAMAWAPAAERTLWRVVVFGLALVVLMCLRPNARLLVARSLVMRTGRVDRQTMLAMAAAVGMLIVGDLLGLLAVHVHGWMVEALQVAGGGLLLVGVMLLVVGLFGSAVDCFRIARAVLSPSPSLTQVMTGDRSAAGGVASGRSEA